MPRIEFLNYLPKVGTLAVGAPDTSLLTRQGVETGPKRSFDRSRYARPRRHSHAIFQGHWKFTISK